MHVWLALADVDEFLALPPRWDVPQFMRKCFVPTALQVRGYECAWCSRVQVGIALCTPL